MRVETIFNLLSPNFRREFFWNMWHMLRITWPISLVWISVKFAIELKLCIHLTQPISDTRRANCWMKPCALPKSHKLSAHLSDELSVSKPCGLRPIEKEFSKNDSEQTGMRRCDGRIPKDQPVWSISTCPSLTRWDLEIVFHGSLYPDHRPFGS
jgi:hypothetical protein